MINIRFNNSDIQKYNLIIICTGNNSSLVEKHFYDTTYEKSYDEVSITTILEHSQIKNDIARQIFLDNEILAFLPIANNKTSVVLSVKKDSIAKYKKNNQVLKNKIKFYAKNFFKKIELNNNLEYKDLNFMLRKKYFKNRILLFGDALHVIHPLAGQGYNIILRDLISLEKIIKKKIKLGLDIGSADALLEFSKKVKPRNFAYLFSIDFIRSIFSFQEKSIKKFRNKILSKMNKNNFSKSIFSNIADEGFRF